MMDKFDMVQYGLFLGAFRLLNTELELESLVAPLPQVAPANATGFLHWEACYYCLPCGQEESRTYALRGI